MQFAENFHSEQREKPGHVLKRRVLRHEIREYLVSAILNGVYQSGDRIVEIRVAQELGVSQGAVREALRELEWMGFLETKPFSGTYVREITLIDLQQIYPVRAALESLGARLAAQNLTDVELDALQVLVDDMVKVSRAGDERGMVERNYQFHEMIMLASRNPFLIRCWSMFQFSYWTSVVTAELHTDLVFLARRHYPIIESLRARDPEQAAQRIYEHLLELNEEISRHGPHALNPRQQAAPDRE